MVTRKDLVEGGVEEVGGGGARGGEPPANREIENELAQLRHRLRRFSRQRVEVLLEQLSVDPPAWDFARQAVEKLKRPCRWSLERGTETYAVGFKDDEMAGQRGGKLRLFQKPFRSRLTMGLRPRHRRAYRRTMRPLNSCGG